MSTHLVVFLLAGVTSSKSPRPPSFQTGLGWNPTGLYILQVNTHRLMESISHIMLHFHMAAMTSFHTVKCCHLVSAYTVSAWHICTSSWSIVHWYSLVIIFINFLFGSVTKLQLLNTTLNRAYHIISRYHILINLDYIFIHITALHHIST